MEKLEFRAELVAVFAKAGLQLPEHVLVLSKPSAADFHSSLPTNTEAAISLLKQQRSTEPELQPTKRQLRHRFSLLGLKGKFDYVKGDFTIHEVAKAFDSLLSVPPFLGPGVLQAVLDQAPETSLLELWRHLHDAKPEKRKPSHFKRAKPSQAPRITWLDDATILDNHDYIHLICHRGIAQEALDAALSIALRKHSTTATKVLLSYGAIASASNDITRERFRLNDIALARLLLSTPHSMNVQDWRYCVEGQVSSCPDILILCLAHNPAVTCTNLLFEALTSENIEATAIMLTQEISDESDSPSVRTETYRLACLVNDNGNRRKLFNILADHGWLEDAQCLQQELMKDVKLRELEIVRILTNAGVALDVEPNNVVAWAISQMDLKMLRLFEKGTFASPASPDLRFVPDSATEDEVVQLLYIFRGRLKQVKRADETLSLLLINSTRKEQRQVVLSLIENGASIEFEEGAPVRAAILKGDLVTLSMLLQAKCSAEILSTAIPFAMALESRSVRLQMMMAIIKKGVRPQALAVTLESLISEDDEVDLALVQFVLKYMPVTDDTNEAINICVLAAIQKGNGRLLTMLCNAGASVETLSNAVPTAFAMVQYHGYAVVLEMIELLLTKGATGLSLHNTLLVAAVEDSRLDIVRILVEHGADANYLAGSAFIVALETKNLELLKIFCKRCPAKQAAMESLLPKVIDARWFNQKALELLLLTSFSSAAALESWSEPVDAMESLRKNPNIRTIINCFLQFGLNVDAKEGALVCLAIEDQNIALLKDLLVANPSINILQKAFHNAANIGTQSIRCEIMELLLWQAGSAEIGQSQCLEQMTHFALSGDSTGLRLVLRHGAQVDYDNGSAVQIAALAGSLEVLDLLLLHRPASSSITRACLAVSSSPSLKPAERQEIFKRFLDAGDKLSAEDLSQLLADCIVKVPGETILPALLLARGVEPTLETVIFVLGNCPPRVYTPLLEKVQSVNTAVELFRIVREKSNMRPNQRYQIYQCLVKKGVLKYDLSWALVDCFERPLPNLDLPKLLLEHGANPAHEEGKAFRLALSGIHPTESFKLLSQYIGDDGAAGIAFDAAKRGAFDDFHQRVEALRSLLQWNIPKKTLRETLEELIQSGHSDTSLVQVLLRKGANPNDSNARSFIFASSADAEPEFRALSRYADLGAVFQALLMHFEVEGQILKWFNMCLEERERGAKIEKDGLLLQCLRKFPNGTAILKLLLDNGVSAGAMTTQIIRPDHRPEQCTALIWALFSEWNVGNDAILALIERGGKSVVPAYCTPITGVSAAFACLLDKTRNPILKALLKLDRDCILSYEIPGSTFGRLSCSSKVPDGDFDLADQVSLYWACIYLGNFDSFSYVRGKRTPNDGLLHLVSLFALPKFVKWLLKTDDANQKGEEFDNLIPLAVVCGAEPLPWSKIASEESDFRTRQKKTMQLLAPKTCSKWRHRGKTVLHFALENGPETTSAMMKALNIKSDKDKHRKYQYTDKEERVYSPHQYVTEFVVGNKAEKKALTRCLIKGGFEEKLDEDAVFEARRVKSMAALEKSKGVVDRDLSSLDLA